MRPRPSLTDIPPVHAHLEHPVMSVSRSLYVCRSPLRNRFKTDPPPLPHRFLTKSQSFHCLSHSAYDHRRSQLFDERFAFVPHLRFGTRRITRTNTVDTPNTTDRFGDADNSIPALLGCLPAATPISFFFWTLRQQHRSRHVAVLSRRF